MRYVANLEPGTSVERGLVSQIALRVGEDKSEMTWWRARPTSPVRMSSRPRAGTAWAEGSMKQLQSIITRSPDRDSSARSLRSLGRNDRLSWPRSR